MKKREVVRAHWKITEWECKVESECETSQENINVAVCGEHHRETQSSPMFSLTREPGARLLGFGSMDSCPHTEKYKQTTLMYCLSFENLTLTNWLSVYGWGLWLAWWPLLQHCDGWSQWLTWHTEKEEPQPRTGLHQIGLWTHLWRHFPDDYLI